MAGNVSSTQNDYSDDAAYFVDARSTEYQTSLVEVKKALSRFSIVTAASALEPLVLFVKEIVLGIEWYKTPEQPWTAVFGRFGGPMVPDIYIKNRPSTFDNMQEVAMWITLSLSTLVTISLFLRKRELEECLKSHNQDAHSNR